MKFLWSSESAKTLGIVFSNDKTKMIENNLMPEVMEFINGLKRWNHRKLSLMGKVTVVKTYALPKVVYPLTVINSQPTAILQNIQLEIFKFIWYAKPDKIKWSVLCQDYKNGGLRLINLENFITALKAGWMKRIFDEQNNGLWKEYYIEKLNAFGGKLVLQSNLDIKDCSQISKVNSFLHDILGVWCKINVMTDISAVSKENLKIFPHSDTH